ncbi:MAG TPA: dihydropyrimidinase, partial [Rhodospirillaceae bacterium]|nr:dihydropyrimidinase [Rhodospirillaceae bacterium]
MENFDLVLRHGTCATASDTFRADIGIKEGRIAAIGESLSTGAREIDATGKLILPGGVDSHCHLAQETVDGVECADDFESGTRSAAFGGTTTVMPFAMQQPGKTLGET